MDLRKVWVIARHEYWVNVRLLRFLILTAFFPFCSLLALPANAILDGISAGLREQGLLPSRLSPKPMGLVDQSGVFDVILPEYEKLYRRYPNEAIGREALTTGEVSVLILVPSDYLETGRVIFIAANFRSGMETVWNLEQIRHFFTAHLIRDLPDTRRKDRALDPILPTFNVLDNSKSGPQQPGQQNLITTLIQHYSKFEAAILLELILSMGLQTSASYMWSRIAEEREGRVLEILLSSAKVKELLAGKIIGLGALGLTRAGAWLVWISVFPAFLRASSDTILADFILSTKEQILRPTILGLGLTYYVLGLLTYSLIVAAIAVLLIRPQESTIIQLMWLGLRMGPFIAFVFSGGNANALWMRGLSWFPLTAPSGMMMRLLLDSVSTWEVVGSILGIIVTIQALLWLTTKLFRFGLLISAARPTVREILRLLRAA